MSDSSDTFSEDDAHAAIEQHRQRIATLRRMFADTFATMERHREEFPPFEPIRDQYTRLLDLYEYHGIKMREQLIGMPDEGPGRRLRWARSAYHLERMEATQADLAKFQIILDYVTDKLTDATERYRRLLEEITGLEQQDHVDDSTGDDADVDANVHQPDRPDQLGGKKIDHE